MTKMETLTFLYTLPCLCPNIIQEIVKKWVDDNVKSENGKMHLYSTCGNNHDGVILNYSGYSIPSLFYQLIFFVS
jgi:hypothetical protein